MSIFRDTVLGNRSEPVIEEGVVRYMIMRVHTPDADSYSQIKRRRTYAGLICVRHLHGVRSRLEVASALNSG